MTSAVKLRVKRLLQPAPPKASFYACRSSSTSTEGHEGARTIYRHTPTRQF